MRYPATEKLEIIRLVEQSHLPAKRTLDTLGIPRTTFYRWYDRYVAGGLDALEDRKPMPGRVWNRIPDDVRRQVVEFALEEPELTHATKLQRLSSREGWLKISALMSCPGVRRSCS